MNNKQLVSLFFGLGFLVLVAGIFATTQNSPSTNNNNQGVLPQTINRTTNNINKPNAINENMPKTNETANKIKTELSKINGVTNVDASVGNNCALISCTVSEDLRNQANFKSDLTNKVKTIEPSLVNVYIMESQDGMNTDLNDIKTKFQTLDTSSFQNFWNKLSTDAKNMINQ